MASTWPVHPPAEANLVALDNLYSGTSPTGLCGTAPTVLWAYNVTTHTGGTVTTSPQLSLDGKEILFVESYSAGSVLHILRWNSADGGTVAASKAPAQTQTAFSSLHRLHLVPWAVFRWVEPVPILLPTHRSITFTAPIPPM